MGVEVVDSTYPAVSVSSTASIICSGDTVDFIAAGMDGGSGPTYQWLINGMPVATGDTLVDNTLSNGDLISCLMTSSLSCTRPVSSDNQISMVVDPRPGIVFSPDTLILAPGSSTVLSPVITGSVASYQWTPSTGLNDPGAAMPQAAPGTTTTYQLSVTGADGCTASAFQTVMVYYLLKMPGAFTPNGDGINDIFRIPPSTPQKIAFFRVYNRWGNLVFQTSDANQGWDGTRQHQQQPTGAYIWEIQFLDPLTNKYLIQTGTVALMR
jgi:gliding motility-associated-like protein